MKIKVKRVRGGSIGDQRDYGLATGSIWNYEDKPSTNNVSTTMTPEKDRENATIEAERGETVVGDLDNDGQLEHAKIGGKRHFEGGTPLNVPDGSFVFSDYNGLLIKNKELLANVFNYKSGKSATPAKVAKRYELNKYKDLLNDPNADFLDQKTAQLMIDNNLKKLGQLALVQESMKGFPDGIPNIALPLFGSDMQAGGSMPEMKRGGLVKAQKGKQVKSEMQQIMAQYPGNWLPEATVEAQYPFGYTGYVPSRETPEQYVARIQQMPTFKGWRKPTGETFLDQQISTKLSEYEPGAMPSFEQQYIGGAPADWIFPIVGAGAAMYGRSLLNLVLPQLAKVKGVWPWLKGAAGTRVGRGVLGAGVGYGTKKGLDYLTGEDETIPVAGYNVDPGSDSTLIRAQDSSAIDSSFFQRLDSLMNGVSPGLRDSTNVNLPPVVQTPPPPVSAQDSTRVTTAPRDTTKIRVVKKIKPGTAVTDSGSLEYMSKKLGGTSLRKAQDGFSVYTPQSQIKSSDDWEVVPSGQVFPLRVNTQVFDPKTGTYTVADPNTGENIALNLDDLYNRIQITEQETGFPIASNYNKGIDQLKKDIISPDPAVREAATDHLQKNYQIVRQKLGLPDYYYDDPDVSGEPYTFDKKLGLYTFSMPGLRKKKKKAPDTPVVTPKKEEEGITYQGKGFNGVTRPPMPPWWKGDVASFLAATGQIVPGYLTNTVRMTPSLMEPAYTEFDPSAIMGAYTTALQNMGTGPQGRGAALSATGAAGKSLEALNRERQGNRQSNLQTFLQSQAANMQALNQANLYNTEEQKDYLNRINTVREATARDLNKKSAQIAQAYAKGLKNVLRTQNINAMLPYQYSDMNTGTVVNPTLKSIYDDPVTGMGGRGNYQNMYSTIYKMLVDDGVPKDDAAKAAAQYAAGAMRASGTGAAATSMFDFLD